MPIVADNPRGGSLTMGLHSNRTINIGIVTDRAARAHHRSTGIADRVPHHAPGPGRLRILCCIPFVILGIEELRKLIWRHSFPTERV